MADYNLEKTFTEILKHFKNSKLWPYRMRFYKDVPISHIRINNPERSFIRYHSYYQDFFSNLDLIYVTNLLLILENLLETNDFFNVQDEHILLEPLTVPESDIAILKNIMQLLRIMVFSDDLNSSKKFRDPIVVSLRPDNKLVIHPGRTRVHVLEYLHKKNNKEYYVDVIYYKHKDADQSDNTDGFLIDKEHIYLKNLKNFTEAYNYPTVVDFFKDLRNNKITIVKDKLNQWYINKYTAYPKEKFIEKFPKILSMCKK